MDTRVSSNRMLFALMLLVGMYFPTSSGGSILLSLIGAMLAVSAIFLAILAMRVGLDEQIALWCSAPIVMWLVFCTLLSLVSGFNANPTGAAVLIDIRGISLGALFLYCLLAFTFSIRVGKLRCGSLTRLLAALSIANVCMGISMLTVQPVAVFMLAHYSAFYDELMPMMLAAYKPVLTFTTHSVAGTFVYLFFWLNFRTYQKTGNRLHLVLAILHVVMCVAIMSLTSLAFAVLAVVELVYNFRRAALFPAFIAYFLTFLVPSSAKEMISSTIGSAFSDFWFNENIGFLVRYAGNGVQKPLISYVWRHPFVPIGITRPADLSIGDSGPLQYMLYGSVVFVLLIYGGLFLFLRRNLHDKWDCYRIFFAILASELGFATLIYSRTFLLVPAFVIYLNWLPPEPLAQAATSWGSAVASASADQHGAVLA